MGDDNDSSSTFKADASRWNSSDLLNLDISYNNEETDLSEFMSKLKIGPNQTPLTSIELCEEDKDVARHTKDVWHIEFNFDMSSLEQTEKKNEIERAQEETKAVLTDLQSGNTHTKTTELQRY